jgi:heme-degrading monooxygenase HmoA
MIARIWHGMVPVSKGDEYLDLMRRIALPEYVATRGNRGAWCLYRTEAGVRHFEMLTLWDDTDAIKRFAGDDYSMAKYYDFDSNYLIELERRVRHCEAYSDSSADLFKPTNGQVRGDENTIARVWRGVVPIEKAEAYFRYLSEFGFRDYQTYAGNRGILLLRRTEEARMHFLLLSFWESRQAIVAYAGADIAKAHYYAYDLECLIDPPVYVEHYELLSGPGGERVKTSDAG